MPISIIVDETGTVNVELEHGLEPSVDLLEIARVTLYLDHFYLFVYELVVAVVRLPSCLLF